MKDADTPHKLDRVLQLLQDRTGLTFRSVRRASSLETIERCMRRAGLDDVPRFAARLAVDQSLLDELIAGLTVGETYFFREPDHFIAIRDRILPDIRSRNWNQPIRIWSAGCASGEEAYSLAMLCDRQGLARRCDILATDISTQALDKARLATYRDWSLRGDAANIAGPYLEHDGPHHRVVPHIRKMVSFCRLNLAYDAFPSEQTGTQDRDLILCRNVLIYFSPAVVHQVLRRFLMCLRPGGWLVTASGDPPIPDAIGFESVVCPHGVFHRRPEVAPPPPPAALPRSATDAARVEVPPVEVPPASPATPLKPDSVREQAERALTSGDYTRAMELTAPHRDESACCLTYIQALANVSAAEALRECAAMCQEHSLSAELHCLHALLLAESRADELAMQATQRALFVDRSLVMAHYLLGNLLLRQQMFAEAKRAFRNVRKLCDNQPADQPQPLSGNETAHNLATAARRRIVEIDLTLEKTS